jgi:pimeloyl-ACP methyl ester carboxylesterase
MFAITPPGHGGTPVPNLRKNSSQAIWHDNLVRAISRFIDDQSLNNIILVGHSWGSSIAVELATARPDRFAMLINLDGGIENSSWRPNGSKQRLDAANKVVETWGKNFEDAEQWRQFNKISPPAAEMITRSDAILWMKLYGSFMATSKDVVLQYWRENFLVDLTEKTLSLRIPILDIKCLNGPNQEASRQAHIDNLTNAGIVSKVKTVFLYDTSHFVMLHRPIELDQLIRDFVEGRNVADLRNR